MTFWGSVQVRGSRLVRSIEVPEGTIDRRHGPTVELRARRSRWIVGVLDALTGGTPGDSDLVLLVAGDRAVPITRTYSAYDLDVLVARVAELLDAGDLDGLADRFRCPRVLDLAPPGHGARDVESS